MFRRTGSGPSAVAILCPLLSLALHTSAARAQEAPALPDLTGIVRDEGWARILGKALFWDTVAAANGTDCGGCHFATGADRRIPDQSPPQAQPLRAAMFDTNDSVTTFAAGDDDDRALVDVCARQIDPRPVEIADSGPLEGASHRMRESADPSCGEDLPARLARTLLVHQPLGARTIDPNDSIFGSTGPHGNLVSPSGRGLDRTYQWMIQQAFEDTLWSASATDSSASGVGTPYPRGGYRKVERNFPLFWGIALLLYESTLDPSWVHAHQGSQPTLAPAPGKIEPDRG